MLKKRILCLVLCFSVFVSCSFFKPKDVYAFAPALTVAGVALALASACGLTFYGTSSDIEEQISSFLSANPDQETFITTLISDHSVDGTFINLGKLVLSQYKDSVLSFLNSVYSFFNNPSTGDTSIPSGFPFSFFSNYDFTFDFMRSFTSIYSHYGLNFSPYFVCVEGSEEYSFVYFQDMGNSVYCPMISRFIFDADNPDNITLVSSNTFAIGEPFILGSFTPYFQVSDALNILIYTNNDTPIKRNFYSGTNNYYFSYSFSSYTSLDPNSMSDGALTRLEKIFTFCSDYSVNELTNIGNIAIFGAPSSGYSYVYPEGVTQSDVITGWTNAFEQSNQDVIIYPLTPDELVGVNGYDIAYGHEGVAGAVEGVDLPQSGVENPDVPVTPDLSGITTLLNNILSFIKSIPATIIGTGSLNFDAFNNINLSHVFPFCIPFDLISSFQVFNRQPVEPILTLDFSGTVFEPVGTYTIDLTQFEPLAKIIRFFSYSFFVLGLVLVTRKIIKG